ncbi:MAG TPA: Ig-like domain-containing protein [Sandaracinaceae bacterium LLY-WYZ-13_1]|nr:Ig-like domain-containing protein [Sandaracinaceae bacterium LLY-WYZ-13_1]
MPYRRLAFLAFALACVGCDGEGGAGPDAGPDAGPPAIDAGPDAGPPPTGCQHWTGDAGPPPGDAGALPDPADFEPPTGPGAPAVAFDEGALGEHCAYLPVGDTDENHHNTGFFLDGYLVRPWAHERGRGGIAVWDFDDPCDPVLVANVLDEQIRETHSTGLSSIGGRWIAVASLTGVQIWDASDVTAPSLVTDLALEGVDYPNAYEHTVMSVFWQAPYLYVGASDNGIYVVDAENPTAPEVVTRYETSPRFRVGQVVVVGNHLYAFSSEGAVAAVVDVRDPANPRPFAGGHFRITDGSMDRFGRTVPLPAYFGHVSGGYTFHPRIGLGGGLAIFDVRDPTNPTFVGDFDAPDGDGGYVFLDEGLAFVGLSDYGAIVDVSDPTAPTMVRRLELTGDLDTITPFGNVAVVSVDDDAVDGQASAVVPFQTEVDATGPAANMVVPADGATDQALTTRVGLTFDEFVAMGSVWRGSVILREADTGRVVETFLSGQEGVVSLWPVGPLRPETTYEVLVPAGGVTDLNGNPTEATFRSTFTTVRCGG